MNKIILDWCDKWGLVQTGSTEQHCRMSHVHHMSITLWRDQYYCVYIGNNISSRSEVFLENPTPKDLEDLYRIVVGKDIGT